MENRRICKETVTHYDGMVQEGIYEYDNDGCLRRIHIAADDGIERERRFFYDGGGLLSKREDYRRGELWKYVEYEYEEPITGPRKGGWEKVLTKTIHRNPDGSVRYFHTSIFEEGRLLKQTEYAPGGGIRYEYICRYKNNRRVRTLKANLEVFSSRIYDGHGAVSEIRLAAGGKTVYLYEPRQTRYEFDTYTVS